MNAQTPGGPQKSAARAELEKKTSDELAAIWSEQDHSRYSDEELAAVDEILNARLDQSLETSSTPDGSAPAAEAGEAGSEPQPVEKVEVPRPANMDVETTPSSLEIAFKTFGAGEALGDVLLLGLILYLLWGYLPVMLKGTPETLLFTVVIVAVLIFYIYRIVMKLVNRTHISVSMGEIFIHRGPLPWPGNKTISAMQITRVEVQEVSSGRGGKLYLLKAARSDGTQAGLLTSRDPRQLLFIEQEIERYLHIEDRPVNTEP